MFLAELSGEGDAVRINAQLVDAKTGLQKWASFMIDAQSRFCGSG